MRRTHLIQLGLIVCAASLALSGCNSSSGSGSPAGSSTTSTVAYIYVSNQTASGGPNQIVAYAADAQGQLAPVSGSPFNQSVTSLAASGGYLVAASASTPGINTYMIGSNGALTLGPQFNYTQETGYQSNSNSTCGAIGGLVLDRMGQSLYASVDNIACSSNNAIASFTFDSSNGNLSYLGNVNIGYESSAAISFLGNNEFAYSALNDACMYGGISPFSRGSTGLLASTPMVETPQFGPPAPLGATSSGVKQPSYAAGLTATDTTNHVAIAEFPCYAQNGVAATQVQLAAYTADASGNLTTVDTSATMPATTISPQDIEMSPSGSVLAVGGIGGLQLFNFNGAISITKLTGVLTTDNISQIFWDKSNHLYAITLSAGSLTVSPGKLHVFTVTDTSASEAPGSPYTITTPIALAVQSE
jgi:predicted small secreted protein